MDASPATDTTEAPPPGEVRADVWLALYAAQDGLTDEELGTKLQAIPPLVWRAGRAELVADGAVVEGLRDGAPVWKVARRRTPEPAPEPPMSPPPPPAQPAAADNRPTVLLIDGKNLLYRALMARGGTPVDVEFPARLREMRERYAPAFAIVAWDADGPTWRHNAYADYKAQRDPPSDYEKGIYQRVPGWSTQCGYQFVEAPGWEADDIIGTYAARLREAHRVVIVTNDKDMTQLLGPGVVMLKGWSEVLTHDDVPKPSTDGGWGVPCALIPDFLAIMGDSSDNIPGVPKVGEVGAAKLINQFGDIEAVIAAAKAGKDKAKGRAERIIAHADALRLFKRLTTISCGIDGLAAPVPCSAMAPSAPGKREALDGMTVLDGVLYPLPETAHMAAQHGWRWTNPTSMPERKQAQLRPGEPLERWEREDHWGYLVERGGQWTLTHRGIDGDIETGEVHLGTALSVFRAYHVAYCAMADALFGVRLLGAEWSTNVPSIALDRVAPALAEAKAIVAAEHARLLAGTSVAPPPPPIVASVPPPVAPPPPAIASAPPPPGLPPAPPSFPVVGTEEQRAVLHAQVDPPIGAVEYPNGVRLTGVEFGTPDGAVALGGIELPAGFAGSPDPTFVEIRVEMSGPEHIEAPPLLAPGSVPAHVDESPQARADAEQAAFAAARPDLYPPATVVVVAPEALEYWCSACRQLRLAPNGKPSACGHCGGTGLLTSTVRGEQALPTWEDGRVTGFAIGNRQSLDAEVAARAQVAAAYGVDPAALPPPPAPPPAPVAPWRIPTDPDPSKATIPTGYARTIVAFTLEAFTGQPQVLCWDLDLKTDLGTPPDGEPGDPNAFADGRWSKLLDRLQGRVKEQESDPAARTQLGVVVRGTVYRGQTVPVVLDLDPVLVNLARIANGPPPAGRWYFYAAKDYASWGPRVERSYFMDGVPF